MFNNNRKTNITTERLIKKVAKYECVSFDVFDTLIKRNVKDVHDIFDIVERRYNQGKNDHQISNFRQLRVKAEAVAYEKYGVACNLNNIYECLTGLDTEVKSQLLPLETQVELDYCVVNPILSPCFEWCISHGKKVLIISDMYLPVITVRKILMNAGYDLTSVQLFVSNECRADKRSGDLFKLVQSQLSNMKSTIHIGDSIRGDFLAARKSGWQSILIPKYVRRVTWEANRSSQNLDFGAMQALINNTTSHLAGKKSEYYTFGYEVFGQVLIGYCNWLYRNLKKRGQHKVYFVSRDGYQLKKVFDQLYAHDQSIESYYIHASRRSLQVALLWRYNSLQEVINNISLPSMFTTHEFLHSVGLPLDENIPNDQFENHHLNENADLHAIFNKYSEAIHENSEKQFKLLKVYLDQLDFQNDAVIVDIGWRGSMQHQFNLIQQLRGCQPIYGYYFGLSEESQKYNLAAQAFLFDGHQNKTTDIVRPFQGLFEMCLSAPEGTTLGYEYRDDIVVATLAKYELSNEQGAILSAIRQGVFALTDTYQRAIQADIVFDQSNAFRVFQQVGSRPSTLDLRLFADLDFSDQQTTTLAKPQRMTVYLRHPQQAKHDLLASRWKVGFLTNLLHLPLPYDRLYAALFKLRSK